jgi:hypothetical protein
MMSPRFGSIHQRNLIWQVNLLTGASSPLVEFPTVQNPAFPTIGGPVVEAVPTGIRKHAGQLRVAPFLPHRCRRRPDAREAR